MHRAFPGRGPEIDARYERAGMFLLASIWGRKDARDWLDRKLLGLRKAQGEGINSAGGFLVPTEFARAIFDIRDSYGALRRRGCVYPMGSDSTLFPRRTGSAQAFFIGEGTAAAATNVNMDSVQLTAKKLGALVTVSTELDEDSIHELVDYVAVELALAFAAKEDDCAFNGDGTSTYAGMRGLGPLATDGNHGKAKVTASSDAYASLTASDLGSLAGGVRASALPRAAYFASVTGIAQFERLATGYLDVRESDGIQTKFYNGFPIVPSDKLPLTASVTSGLAMMAFGDMYAGAVLGQRRGITIARSDERYLEFDQIGILGTERIDIAVHDMGDNANAGSLAVLIAP